MAKTQTALDYLTGSSAPGKGVQYDENDIDKLTRTILGEAGNQSEEGKAAVAHIIVNRLNKGGYGNSIADVATSGNSKGYHQFSAWNDKTKGGNDQVNLPATSKQYLAARAIAEQVLTGGRAPPAQIGTTAVNYYAPAGMVNSKGERIPDPKWSKTMVYTGTIGGHRFYAPKGSGAVASSDRTGGSISKNTQDVLRYAGFNPGKSDGVFGPKTEAAVKAFQSTHGLKVDGIVGPKTLAALQSAATSRLPPGPVAGTVAQPGVAAPPQSQYGSAFQPERNGWGSNGFTYAWQNKGLHPDRPQIIPTQGGGYPPVGTPANTNGFRDPLTAAPPGSATGGGVWPPPLVAGPGFDLGPSIATVQKLSPKRTAVASVVDIPTQKVVKKPKLDPGSSGRNGTATRRTQASQGETFDSVWNEAKGF